MCAAMRNVIFLLLALFLALCPASAWAQNDPLFEAIAAGRLEDVERLVGAGAAKEYRTTPAVYPFRL